MKTNNKNKKVVRLTESQLKQIVAESVKRALKEQDFRNVEQNTDDYDDDYDDDDVSRRYDIYVCEWVDGKTNTYWDSETGRDCTTLEQFQSDAWSYCEFAEVPTIAILYDGEDKDEPLYYCSPHFTRAAYK